MAVAILSTGDELVNGDVQNTTSFEIAHHLFDYNVPMGSQIVVSDDETSMLQAMRFLFEHHDVLIVTGGLGPTSDDRTRFVMGEYFDEPLVFHEACWTHITTRHQSLAIETSQNNRQQALFPKTATLFPNPFGTAYGCLYAKKGKTICLLPGPPNECMPMFHQYVLPALAPFKDKQIKLYRWLLFGIPEATIAHQVEDILKDITCDISYRWFYPYIEIKIKVSNNQLEKSFFDEKLKTLFAPLTISPPNKTALTQLQENVRGLSSTVLIDDQATHGALESQLVQPGLSALSFHPTDIPPAKRIEIKGFSHYWGGLAQEKEDKIYLKLNVENQQEDKVILIPLKRSDPLKYALELIAYQLNGWLDEKVQCEQ